MTLTNRSTYTVTENTYHLSLDGGQKVNYTEFLNAKGKLTDCVLRDDSGNTIDDAALLEEIQEFVDLLPN